MAKAKTSKTSKASKSNGAAAHDVKSLKVERTIEVSPNDLTISDRFRGRAELVSEDEAAPLAASIAREGQQQPIQVMEENGKYVVVFGNTRATAGKMIVKGFELEVAGSNGKQQLEKFAPKPDFKLRAEVVSVDPKQAFLHNLQENAGRYATNPIDDALNYKRLSDEYDMTDADIARFFGFGSQSTVSRRLKLLDLHPDIQDRIRKGQLGARSGADIAAVTSEHKEQQQILTFAEEFAANSKPQGGADEGIPEITLDHVTKAISKFESKRPGSPAAIQEELAEKAREGARLRAEAEMKNKEADELAKQGKDEEASRVYQEAQAKEQAAQEASTRLAELQAEATEAGQAAPTIAPKKGPGRKRMTPEEKEKKVTLKKLEEHFTGVLYKKEFGSDGKAVYSAHPTVRDFCEMMLDTLCGSQPLEAIEQWLEGSGACSVDFTPDVVGEGDPEPEKTEEGQTEGTEGQTEGGETEQQSSE